MGIKEDFRTLGYSAAVRAVRTFAQTALALIPAGVMVEQVDWRVVLSTSLLSAVVSVLMSLMTGLPEVDDPDEPGEAKHLAE
jgi:hypothetical protein